VGSRALLFLVLSACVDPMTPSATSTPAWTARNVARYGETVTGQAPPETSFARDLTVAGGRARWRECSAPDACTGIERERPAEELLSYAPVGEIEHDGGVATVYRLELAPRPRYIVPMKPPR
jgi:hypothetical protein